MIKRVLGRILRGLFTERGLSVLTMLVVALLAVNAVFSPFQGKSATKTLPPDTPPGEYLYLDKARVRSYLGQLVDGLPASEKRTLAESEDLAAEVKAGGAGFSGGRKRAASTETQVAPTVADRFYLLLRLLRGGESKPERGDSRKWLFELDLDPKAERSQSIYKEACKVHEGDFVRISNAHLFLSPYAAVLPMVTYARLNLTGGVARPDPRVLAPGRAGRRWVDRYRRLLGKDPRLPFIVPTLTKGPHGGRPAGITFFLPTLYKSLRNEPSLISGTLTIVGKVVYLNLARKGKPNGERLGCNEERLPDSIPPSYLDRMTVATFVPALKVAPNFIFDSLRFRIGTIAEQVTANMTVAAPVIVVIPIAMYQ